MELTPLKLHPCYKDYLWGGERLRRDYHKADAPDITAESWELAQRPEGVSAVESGPLAGKTPGDLAALDKDAFWGTDCAGMRDFPLLVKLIDARKDLSIQVHPSDETALREQGEAGKAEMWYIVDCDEGAAIYFGFAQEITPEEFRRRAENGTICQVLNRVPVQKGDTFFILPGTIHAICAGILIAEIQQNSNTTYRVFDYGRLGADGKPRALHVEKALDVARLHLDRAAAVLDYTPLAARSCAPRAVTEHGGYTAAELFACDYFSVERLDVRTGAALHCGGDSFRHLLCVAGEGAIVHGGVRYPLRQGDSYFLPAALGAYAVEGACRVLLSRV